MTDATPIKPTSTYTNRDLALRIAGLGLPLFPCKEGGDNAKAPYTPHGFKDATTDTTKIKEWWDQWPGAVPAIPTGEVSGISVIDGDIDRDTGEAMGETQIRDLGLDDPKAVRVRTQSGGVQIIYAHVEGARTTSKRVASHVDTRGQGGYIIAPGAMMADGRSYQYAGRTLSAALGAGDLPPFPVDVVERAKAPDKGCSPPGTLPDLTDVSAGCQATEPTDDQTKEVLRTLLAEAPNTLAREDWVKLALSLRAGCEGALRDEFIAFSERYEGGTPCTVEAAQKVWDSCGDPRSVSGFKSALYLLKEAVGAARYNEVQSTVRRRMEGRAGPVVCTGEGPQPLVREIAPCAPYPVEALGPLRAVAEDVQGMTQAPVAIPAASALTVASLAVQGFADVETLGGYRPLSLYALTIARSGERKSSCDERMMKALRLHEREGQKAQRAARSKWENDHALWKGQRDMILNEMRKNKGERKVADEADLHALGPEPTEPPCADRTVSEPTFEGLTKLFAVGQPSLGIFSDEGGQFLGGSGMSKDHRQKTLAALNKLWGGDEIQRTRAGDGHSTLYGRRLAIHLMVQPGVARDFMSDPTATDTGFLPRFLICEPPSTIGTRTQANARPSTGALDVFGARLTNILNTPMPMDPEMRALEPRLLPLSTEARKVIVTFSDEVEVRQAECGDLQHVSGYASKAAEQAARIAGVLTLWDDLEASEVSAQAMANGITLARFYLSEAVRLCGVAQLHLEIENAEALRKWLLDKWEHPEVTTRDIVRRGPHALRDTSSARAVLGLLEQHGWVRRLPQGTVVRGSHRVEVWQIVRDGE